MSSPFSVVAPLIQVAVFASLTLGAQSPGAFTRAGAMRTARSWHTATLLPNGKVLIAGGVGSDAAPLETAELFDPATGGFTPTGSMSAPRAGHLAALLGDGTVLVVGGQNDLADLYDASTGAFTAIGPTGFTWVASANLMGDGRVLLTGCALPCGDRTDVRFYDPVTRTFVGSEAHVDVAAAVTLLADGRGLITGGCQAQLFDPASGKFTPTGDMAAQCSRVCGGAPCGFYEYTATTLLDGGVLLMGAGEDAPVDLELYVPGEGSFRSLGTRRVESYAKATLIPDGTVLISGLDGASLYRPATATVEFAATMDTPRGAHTSTLLPDGSVLLAGGEAGIDLTLRSAEVYRPAVAIAAPTLLSLSGDGRGPGAILHAGTARAVSANDPAVAGEYLEVYLTGLVDGSAIAPQISIGGRAAEALWFGRTPGFRALNQINVRVPRGLEPGTSVPVRLIYLAWPSNIVTIAVQ